MSAVCSVTGHEYSRRLQVKPKVTTSHESQTRLGSTRANNSAEFTLIEFEGPHCWLGTTPTEMTPKVSTLHTSPTRVDTRQQFGGVYPDRIRRNSLLAWYDRYGGYIVRLYEFLIADLSPEERLKTAMNASWGISTEPTSFIRDFPSFCFSSSFRLRVMSPP